MGGLAKGPEDQAEEVPVKTTKWSGDPIAAPGMFSDIDIARYHELVDGKYVPLCDGTSVSSTALRTIFVDSPADYWDVAPLNPNRADQKGTEGLILGRGCHHLMLGQPNFAREFIIRPDTYVDDKTATEKPWNGNAHKCRGWLAAAKESGKTVLTSDMVERIKGMALSLGKHPLVRAGALNGLIERTMIFRDKETGLFVKVRPDAIPTDSGDYTDLKSAAEVGDGADRSLRERRYDMQGALIRWACRELGLPFSGFSNIFVQSKRPHSTDVVVYHDADLDEAEKDCRTALRVFAHCLKTKEWWGPVGTQRDARTAFFSEAFRERAKFRREFLQREIGSPL